MKHYVFFIGGTGARVLTSFLHICASGMVRMDDTVRLMMLDADTENGACRNAMGLYRIYHTNYTRFHSPEITKALGKDTSQAFYTDLELPDNVVTPVNTKTATLDLATADRGGKKALEWFYTKEEREQNLSRGFYAHPNIGCIYFQDLDKKLSDYTRQIRDAVSKGEDTRVVIVGSMFGGTGAAGTPSVLKLIQRACLDGGLTKEQIRQRLHFCGVLVTPYFKVVDVLDKKDSFGGGNIHINSNTFFNNTQAALNYYGFRFAEDFENIYLVGQNGLQLVNSDYVDGGREQENKPHVVELIAAMSVKNFLQQTERGDGALQVYSQILDVEAKKPIFGWDTLDPDLGYVADMLRTQALLKVTFGPYADKPRGLGRPTWYQAFRMNQAGRKEELSFLMQYTDYFSELVVQHSIPTHRRRAQRRETR